MRTIREGELFTSRVKNPGFCPSLFILLCTNVVSKWHSILDGNLRVVNTGQFNMSEASTAVLYCLPYPSLHPSHRSTSSWVAHTHLWWPQQNSRVSASPLGIVKLKRTCYTGIKKRNQNNRIILPKGKKKICQQPVSRN